MNDTMRFCKDCRFFGPEGSNPGQPTCLRMEAVRPGQNKLKWMVFGGDPPPTEQYDCSAMRAGICGANAVLFEPRLEKVA